MLALFHAACFMLAFPLFLWSGMAVLVRRGVILSRFAGIISACIIHIALCRVEPIIANSAIMRLFVRMFYLSGKHCSHLSHCRNNIYGHDKEMVYGSRSGLRGQATSGLGFGF